MEYVPGGDFRTLLNNSGVLKEEHARFYISEMFVAVNELHKLGYIHRDLKPEVGQSIFSLAPSGYGHAQNFLVDGTGHVKLTDFGLATGALNPRRIESLKIKVGAYLKRPPVGMTYSCSLTRSKTIKLCIDQLLKGVPFIVLFVTRIRVTPTPSWVRPITWHLKSYVASRTHTPSTTGP